MYFYKNRWTIERVFLHLNSFRRVVVRYDRFKKVVSWLFTAGDYYYLLEMVLKWGLNKSYYL